MPSGTPPSPTSSRTSPRSEGHTARDPGPPFGLLTSRTLLPVRDKIERASVPALTFLGRLPRLVPFFVLLVLLVVGALAGGPTGFILMGLAALFVGWLLYLSWPRLTGSEKLMRSAVVLLALALAITQLVPRR